MYGIHIRINYCNNNNESKHIKKHFKNIYVYIYIYILYIQLYYGKAIYMMISLTVKLLYDDITLYI